MKSKLLSAAGLLTGIAVGGGILLLLMATRPKPRTTTPPDNRPRVRTVVVSPTDYQPVVEAFGTVRPSEQLAVSVKVTGEISRLGPGVTEGAVVEKGALLFRIDETPLRFEIARQKAQRASLQAQVEEMTVQHEADRTLLKLEKDLLALAEKDYRRKQGLANDRQVSDADVEAALSRVTERRLALAKREGLIAAYPKRRAAAVANQVALDASIELLETRRLDTVVSAPFRCRVLSVAVREGQVVQQGTAAMVVFSLDDPVEVTFPLASDVLPVLYDPEGIERGTPPWRQVALEAEVLWEHFGVAQKATGVLSRFLAQVDPATRTLTGVVTLPGPAEMADRGGGRGLLPGAFVTVRLRGRKLKDVYVLPERALDTPTTVFSVRHGKLRQITVAPMAVLGSDVIVPCGGPIEDGAAIVPHKVDGAVDGLPVRVSPAENDTP